MSRRVRQNGAKAIERRIAEGRGRGKGRDYQPWLLIHDISSRGLSSRMKSPLNGRTYHLLSQLETDWLYAFHGCRAVVDIREQYPLLDLEETEVIAERLGVAHPAEPQTRESCVMTTDFLVTAVEGTSIVDRAFAVKPASALASTRTLEKLEVERHYWLARNIDWQIITEKELPTPLVRNLRWVLPHVELEISSGLSKAEIDRVRRAMEPVVFSGEEALAKVAAECDDRLGLRPGAALCVARHLIATWAWPVDLNTEIDPRKPINLLRKGTPIATTNKFVARMD